VNNDSLANALAALTLIALAVGLRRGFDDRGAIGLGFLIGALLLTKVTVYVYVPLALAALLWWELRTAGKGERSWPVLLRRPALAIAAAGSISSWWFVRNGLLYGWTDPLASGRHAEVVVGQPRWAQFDLAAAAYFAQVLFRSFWGQFGWMGVVLDDRTYLFYLGLTLLAMIGLGVAALDAWRRPDCAELTEHREILAVVVGALVLVLAGIVFYNLTFIQPQGRYLFPALVPIALLLALGWWRLADLVASLTPWRALVERGLLLVLGIGLGLLNLFCLVRFVAPAFR
jgi:4-amino-4-deoxy-L-arabinose transferase-like glycosyltransferase